MILQLVTDRQRLASGATDADAAACLLDQARYAAAAGIDYIQVRERDLDGRELAGLVRAIVAVTRNTRTRVLVNDRLDVAIATRADGVHLRADSMAAEDVRRCTVPGFLVGRSVHGSAEARSAGPVDYLVAGTVWATSSKPEGHPLIGVDGLARIAAAASVPVLAIGGIESSSARRVFLAGAAGVAAIGLWMGTAEESAGGCRAIPLQDVVQTIHAAGDAANMKRHFSAG